MKENIEKLLKSKMVSNYTISKITGIAQSTISGYVTGTNKIGNMKLDHAILLNEYYTKNWKEKVEEMENIKEIIGNIENGKVDLVQDFEIYEREYMDAATEKHIVHYVEGEEDLEVFFAEREHFKVLNDAIYNGEADESAYDDLVNNELSDQYDYDKVVAYRVEDGQIEWV